MDLVEKYIGEAIGKKFKSGDKVKVTTKSDDFYGMKGEVYKLGKGKQKGYMTVKLSNGKVVSYEESELEKVSEAKKLSVPDKHQLKILKDTVKNPMKGKFLGGPSAEEAEKILRQKFGYTDSQIKKLKS